MKRTLNVSAAIAAVMGLAFLFGSEPANARGCGGYVNQVVWGCAVWDNNPKCPYHPDCKKAQMRPVSVPMVVVQGRPVAVSSLRHDGRNVYSGGQIIGKVGQGGRLVSQGGGNLVAQGGGNLIAQGGGNIVSTGGGN